MPTKKQQPKTDFDIPEYQLESLARVLLPIMQETLDIDKENKELKAYKVRAAKALALLAKLERENPSAYNALFESKQKPPVPSPKNWWSK